MPNHEEQMERRLQQALEQVKPDEAAKDRMYLEIMRRAASQETVKKRPWYLRWQTSAGICTAALACVVVAAASLHGRMPQGGTEQLQVVTPETVTTGAVSEEAASGTVSGEQTEFRTETVTAVQSDTEAVQTQAEASDAAYAETESAAVPKADQPAVTGQAPGQVQRQTTTAAPAAVTTAVQTEAPAAETTAKSGETTASEQETSAAPAVTTAQTDSDDLQETHTDIPIRQNIYLYYKLTWDGVRYDTQYVQTTGKGLEYLGYGVTSGAETDGT
ncbi:MAG: hypothetical protein ACI4XB_07155, partial [Ruminococcus sp.]